MGLFGTGVTVDLRQFNQALREYASVSRRDWSYILNKQMGNIAARASGFAPIGSRADIQGLEGRKWWPAFLRKVVGMKGGFTLTKRVKAKGAAANVTWTDPVTGRSRQGRKTMGVKVKFSAGMAIKKADLKRISKAIIKRRLSTWKAMRAQFGVVALKFGVPLGRFERPGRLFALPHEIATDNRLRSSFTLPFKNKKTSPWPPSKFGRRPSPSQDVAAKKRIGNKALQMAVDFVTRDMHNWAAPRIAATAARFSGRRAA